MNDIIADVAKWKIDFVAEKLLYSGVLLCSFCYSFCQNRYTGGITFRAYIVELKINDFACL